MSDKPQRAPAPQKTPGKNGFKYQARYGLIITCKDEAQQQAYYAALAKQGYKVKVVCV